MVMKNNFTLKTRRIKQNNQEFLLGVFKIQDILTFTRYSEYTILGFDEEHDNKPITKKEVQRKLSPSKVQEIADFLINDPIAIFPTNLVASIPKHVVEYIIDEPNGCTEIKLKEIVFDQIKKLAKDNSGDVYITIIDGQHRLKGIEVAIEKLKALIHSNEEMIRSSTNTAQFEKNILEAKSKLKNLDNIELPVSFFYDPVLEYQAMVFSTINRTQTKVSPDLVYSLFGLTKKDSPQKSALNIINTLNGRENSPFYKRIRLAGASSKVGKDFYKEGNPILSQATMVKSILFMICKNNRDAENERHAKSRTYFLDNPNKELLFRKYYGQNNDEKIIKILFSFYKAVQNSFIDTEGISYWDFIDIERRKPTNILQTTIGYEALLMILKFALPNIKEENNEKVETYTDIIKNAKSLDFKDDNEPKIYPFANKTKNKFYNDLGEKIWGSAFPKKPIVD
jgi:DGQHR domain-containing protein